MRQLLGVVGRLSEVLTISANDNNPAKRRRGLEDGVPDKRVPVPLVSFLVKRLPSFEGVIHKALVVDSWQR